MTAPANAPGRVVTFGEVLLRLGPPGHERLLQSPELRVFFGGSEANVAVSLAHFGLRSEHVTRVPANAIGDAGLRALRAEGVSTDAAVRGGTRLGIYFVEPGAGLRPMRVVYDRAGSAFSQVDAGLFDWRRILDGAAWFHVSGITPALGGGAARCAEEAVAAARAAGATVSVDLNYRAALWAERDPRPVVRALVAAADLLIANAAAADAMLDLPAGGDVAAKSLAGRIIEAAGCRRVALTCREQHSASEHGWSATLHDAEGRRSYASRRYQVRVVDRVGGGDSFAAALIFALLGGRPAQEALDFAVAASALKLTIPGDWNRVSVDEVEHALNEAR